MIVFDFKVGQMRKGEDLAWLKVISKVMLLTVTEQGRILSKEGSQFQMERAHSMPNQEGISALLISFLLRTQKPKDENGGSKSSFLQKGEEWDEGGSGTSH